MRKILPLLLPLFGILPLAAENLVFNPGFEMGSSGFAVYRLLRPDTNSGLEFRPLEIDAASPFEGKNALKLANPNSEYFQLRSREFQLKPGTSYVFRAAMRSSVPGYRLRLHAVNVDRNGKWSVHGQDFVLQPKWQTFHFEFKTEPGGPYMLYFFNQAKEVPAGDVWFDDLSVAERDALPGPGKLAAAVVFDEPLHVLTPGTKAPMRVILHNQSKGVLKKQLNLQLADDATGERFGVVPLAFSLAPGEVKEFKLELPLDRFGAFTVTPEAEFPLDVLPGCLTVIGPYTPRPVDLTRDFCVGVNGGNNFLSDHYHNTTGGYTAYNAPYETLYRRLEQIGCRILRDHDGGVKLTNWAQLEPEKGRFDFSYFDRFLDVCDKYRLTFLPCFGRVYGRLGAWEEENYPEWLKPELVRIKNPPGTNPKFLIDVPREAELRRYVAAFTEHAGNRISAYEVMNEPNLNLSAETYVGYLKPAYEAIKAVNPAATVLGICVTGDFDNALKKFTEECIRLGALKFLDAVSFHPYNARELSSIMPADRQIDELRAIAGKVPLYNTEVYYLFDTEEKNAQHRAAPAHAATRFLVDLGEGVRQSISLNQGQLWRQPLHPGHDRLTELVPNNICVAYNALARHFEGAKPVTKFRPGHGVIVYGYERDGKPLAAIWNYEKRAGIRADFTGLEVLDLFGNPVKAGAVPITESPLYLFPGKLSAAEFRASLAGLKPKPDEPLTVTPFVRVFREENGTLTAIVNLRNETNQPVPGFAGLSGGFTALKRHNFTVPAGSILTLEIPVAAAGSAQTVVGIYVNGRLSQVPVETVVNPVLANGKSFRIASPDNALAATGTATFAGKRLTVEFDVTDSTDAGPSGERKPWESDSIELFFDSAPTVIPALHPGKYTAGTGRAFITPRDPEGKQLTLWSETLKTEELAFTCRTTPAGYRVRLELPLEVSGGYLGFEVKVNDAAENGRRQASWCGAPLTYEKRTDFGIIRIKEKP